MRYAKIEEGFVTEIIEFDDIATSIGNVEVRAKYWEIGDQDVSVGMSEDQFDLLGDEEGRQVARLKTEERGSKEVEPELPVKSEVDPVAAAKEIVRNFVPADPAMAEFVDALKLLLLGKEEAPAETPIEEPTMPVPPVEEPETPIEEPVEEIPEMPAPPVEEPIEEPEVPEAPTEPEAPAEEPAEELDEVAHAKNVIKNYSSEDEGFNLFVDCVATLLDIDRDPNLTKEDAALLLEEYEPDTKELAAFTKAVSTILKA